jgi:hypothetical protein
LVLAPRPFVGQQPSRAEIGTKLEVEFELEPSASSANRCLWEFPITLLTPGSAAISSGTRCA